MRTKMWPKSRKKIPGVIVNLALQIEGDAPNTNLTSVDTDPLTYVNPVNAGLFSFQWINVQKVIKLLKTIDVGKATGLDKIPNRPLMLSHPL